MFAILDEGFLGIPSRLAKPAICMGGLSAVLHLVRQGNGAGLTSALTDATLGDSPTQAGGLEFCEEESIIPGAR